MLFPGHEGSCNVDWRMDRILSAGNIHQHLPAVNVVGVQGQRTLTKWSGDGYNYNYNSGPFKTWLPRKPSMNRMNVSAPELPPFLISPQKFIRRCPPPKKNPTKNKKTKNIEHVTSCSVLASVRFVCLASQDIPLSRLSLFFYLPLSLVSLHFFFFRLMAYIK